MELCSKSEHMDSALGRLKNQVERWLSSSIGAKAGKTSHHLLRATKKPRSETMYLEDDGSSLENRYTDLIRNGHIAEAQRKTKAFRGNKQMQPRPAYAAADEVHRLNPQQMNSPQVSKVAVEVLDDAIVNHEADNIVGARRSIAKLFKILVINKAQCFDFPFKYGLDVLDRGRQLFLEEGVSCSIKHGTLLLDSSTNGAQFYSGLLNVLAAFAFLISEFEIAKKTFDRLIHLHRQLNVTSRSHDLGAAYNNKGCIHLIMGDFPEAEEAFETSLRYFGNWDRSSISTEVFAVNSNMSRLNLVFREYGQSLKTQERLVESCKATEMKNISYPFEAVFTVMNNQAVLHTTLGNFDRAEEALRWLICYCKEIDRNDSLYLVNFLRLHLSEVLLLHGKSKEADDVCNIEELNSLEEIVEKFGNLYLNVRIEALEKLIDLYIRRGKVTTALRLLQTTVKILKTVFGHDHFNIASLLYKQGTILNLTGEIPRAAEKLKNSSEILQRIFGVKNFLLLKCYISLGDVTLRMNQGEESFLYFQRAVENIEAIYQVSFENELAVKYHEITRGFKTSQRRSVSGDRIEGLVAEYGHGIAFLLNHHSNGQSRKCRAIRKLFHMKNMEGEFSNPMSIVSSKYSSDFIKGGQKLVRLGMIKEASVFFQYAELHCGVHVIQDYPDVGVARLHSIFLKEKFRSHGTLKHDHGLKNFLGDLTRFIELSGAQSMVKSTNGVATAMEVDYLQTLRPVLILLLLWSIELKMIETTFEAYNLFSELFKNESDSPFLLLDGIQVYASKAIITCNGETAVQDIMISSAIGLNECDGDRASADTELFRSLACQENATGNAFLVAGRSPVFLDIEDLNTVKEKISLAVQECFQMKCMKAETKCGATKVVVDLTPTANCDLRDILSMGSRIDLLPLCLSEHPSTGVLQKETIFEMDTSMCQRITKTPYEDEQKSCFMFQKIALSLLQQGDEGRISSLSLPSHKLSLTILHPEKARLILSRTGKWITQKIQSVTTKVKIKGLANSNGTLQASFPDALSWTDFPQTVKNVLCQKRTLSEASLAQSVTLRESSSTFNHGWRGAERSSQVYGGEIGVSSELEDRQKQTREKLLERLMTVSQISRLLYSVERPVTYDDICLADPDQCLNAHESLEDQKCISRKDNGSLVELGDDDTRRLTVFFQNQEDQENTSSTLQHLTESSIGNENNKNLTLNAPDITTVEASTSNHGDESMLREEVCEILEGKSLFEDDRKSRRSFMADLQKRLKDKQQNQLNSNKGYSIQSNRADPNDVSKLQSRFVQNGSNCGNLEVPHQNPEAQAPSPILTSRNVSARENSHRTSSLDGKTAKEEDKLMKKHPSPQSLAPNNVRDRDDLEDVSSRLPESRWPKTTLEKEPPYVVSDESDSSSLLERKTYAENVETTRNDVRSSTQNAIKTNRKTPSRNQEVQDTLRVDEEGQRQTKPSVNNLKRRKQHSLEGSELIEVEITGHGTNTLENQETPCPDYDDKATWKTFGSLAEDVLPDGSMDKDTSGGQNNVVDLLNETHTVDGPNQQDENGIHSMKARESTILSKSKATISIWNETTTRFMCQGSDVVADGESHKDLAVDGSILAKSSDKDNHAHVLIPDDEVEKAIGVDREGQRQTTPDVSKFQIKKQGRERSGVEILRRKTNASGKEGTSCSDHNELTTERRFEALGSNQSNVVNFLRETDFVDGPKLKEENGMQFLNQGSRAIDPISSSSQINFKSQTSISKRHETSTRSICEGGDVVTDGESSEDNPNNFDTVDGPAFAQNPLKAFNAGERFTANMTHKSVTSGSEKESHADRDALCEHRYPLKSETDLFQSHLGDGGARPKQRSTDKAKCPLPWPSLKNPMSAFYDLELKYPGLDPVFMARHVKESCLFPSFHYGGNHKYASLGGPWQKDYGQECSANAHYQVFRDKGQNSHDKKEFISHSIANRYDMRVPVINASGTKNFNFHHVSTFNGEENESWHFPSSESCEERVPRSQYFAERTNESNPTSLPISLDTNREKLFDMRGSICAYNDMDSMANEYSSRQSLPLSEKEYSPTEHSLASSFVSLQEIMAETIRLVVSKTTGAGETQPANQSVVKTGVQEGTDGTGDGEPAVTQHVNERNTQVESSSSNQTTIGAERQHVATPVQESPRPVCSHYQRRCLVKFPCCGKFFPCHRCHNESDCSEDQARAINATHIRCTICYHEQEIDENGQRCGGCNAIMSEYFCSTCRHYTSVDKNPFHCEKCGICRIHRDRSFHCDVCNVCLDKRLEGKHKCRPDSGHDECCICLEDAFSGCQILPCSHKVHKDCAIAMIQNGVRTCPICRHPLFGQLQNSTQ